MKVKGVAKEIHLRSPAKKPIAPYTAELVLSAFFTIVKRSVASGEAVEFSHFGRFTSKTLKAIKRMNPNEHARKYTYVGRVPVFQFFHNQHLCKR